MKTNRSETISDLKLLIDISCVEFENLLMFEQFHKMLIRIAYKATDISIDYNRKRIYMYVVGEDTCGDYLVTYDQQLPTTMAVNLVYEDLSDFLKSCVLEEVEDFKQYYPLLISRFFKSNTGKKEGVLADA